MANKKHSTLALAILLMTTACSTQFANTGQNTPGIAEATPAATRAQPPSPVPTPVPAPPTPEASTPTVRWLELLRRTPYPYSTPLPPPEPTILDGTYTKFDPRQAGHVPCKRCPAYPPGGGVWRLNLDRGIFRVYHRLTGWVTLGSFTVSEDRIEFFNDPHCFQDTGLYIWELTDGELTLKLVEDNCGVYLRANNLVALPWQSCQPPSTEAAITNHWPTPVGCDTTNTTD
jgi:hypothetical protein